MDTRRPARWADQHPAARVALLLVLTGSTVLLGWNLARGGDAPFYAAAARSMSGSWHALWSGSFDPSGTVTLDKLSGFLVPQALSIRLFGDSTSALALPQVVEGLVTVWACSVVGLRWAGAGTGLVAALAAASTPIFVSVFAHPMEDALVTAALAVALLCWQRAAITGTWWPLVASGLAVGVGFQAKMLQAWFILPALVAGALLADARPDGRRWSVWMRLGRSAVLGTVAVAAALLWIVWLAATPAGARPVVDGSTDADPWAMVFGYNGLDRFRPGTFPGSVAVHPSATPAPSGDPGGLTKLLEPHLGSQVSWLLPAALFAVLVGAVVVCIRRRDRAALVLGGALDTRAGAVTLVVVTVWLATAAAVLSVARIPHTAYVAAVGVQLAVLAAVGWCGAVGLARSRSAWLRALPLVLAVGQEAWWLFLAHGAGEPTVLAHAAHVVANASVVAAVVALLWQPRQVAGGPSGLHRASRAVIATATGLALVAGPAAFSLQALDAARDGSGLDASVGRTADAAERFRVSSPDWRGGEPTAYPVALRRLVALSERIDGPRHGVPLFLTDTWRLSSRVISATGLPVLTDGGFSGTVAVFTTHQIRERIDHGLRVVVVREGTRLGDPVLRAVLLGGCRTVGDVLPGRHHTRGRWAIAGLRWSVWRCGLSGPSVGSVLVHPADGHGRVELLVRPARAPRAGTSAGAR